MIRTYHKLLRGMWYTSMDYRRFRVYSKEAPRGKVYVRCLSKLRYTMLLDKILFQEVIYVDDFLFESQHLRVDKEVLNLLHQITESLRRAGAQPDGLSLRQTYIAPRHQILEDALSRFDVVYDEVSEADDVVREVCQTALQRVHYLLWMRSISELDDADHQELLDLAGLRWVQFDP